MRAPSKKKSAVDAREADQSRVEETPTTDTVTRVSPFRVSTLVSLAPVNITNDFGVMARHEGDPVPHEHQFYRATLKGLFSLDLHAAGTFSYRQQTGYRNLDDERMRLAAQHGLEHVEKEKSYRLPLSERIERVRMLLDGLARLEGGAKQTIHYTDVAPPLVILAVTRGGNHVFGHVIGTDSRQQPVINTAALEEALSFADDLLSLVYVGWTRGYLDEQRRRLSPDRATGRTSADGHPRAFAQLSEALAANPEWMA